MRCCWQPSSETKSWHKQPWLTALGCLLPTSPFTPLHAVARWITTYVLPTTDWLICNQWRENNDFSDGHRCVMLSSSEEEAAADWSSTSGFSFARWRSEKLVHLLKPESIRIQTTQDNTTWSLLQNRRQDTSYYWNCTSQLLTSADQQQPAGKYSICSTVIVTWVTEAETDGNHTELHTKNTLA